jgi:hypothetical protein
MTKRASTIFITSILTLTFLLLFVSPAVPTPVYSAGNAISLAKGNVVVLWNAETPTPGNGGVSASQQVGLPASPDQTGTPFSMDGKFSGAPGAFEIDVQVAAVDADTNYQTISGGAITTVDATNNTFHLDAPSVVAKYARLLMRSRTNSVSITATVTGG